MFELKSAVTLLGEKLIGWYEALVKNIPNLFVAVVVFFLFIVLANLAKKGTKQLLPRFSDNKSVVSLLATIMHFTIILLGVFTALEILGLEKTVTSILAGAGVIGLALGFAFQEIASNFVSGILIAFSEPYKVGDIVKVGDYLGEVTRIELRTTCITTFQGLEVYVPNKDMFTKPVTNYTSTPRRRIDLKIGVTYGEDLRKVERVVKRTLENVGHRLKGWDTEAFFAEFGDSSINLVARFWVDYTNGAAYFEARHDAVIAIQEAFAEEGIVIPFPIRTLEVADTTKEFLTKQPELESTRFV